MGQLSAHRLLSIAIIFYKAAGKWRRPRVCIVENKSKTKAIFMAEWQFPSVFTEWIALYASNWDEIKQVSSITWFVCIFLLQVRGSFNKATINIHASLVECQFIFPSRCAIFIASIWFRLNWADWIGHRNVGTTYIFCIKLEPTPLNLTSKDVEKSLKALFILGVS